MKVSIITPEEIKTSSQPYSSDFSLGDDKSIPNIILLIPAVLDLKISAVYTSYHEVFATLFQNALRLKDSEKDKSDKLIIRLISFLVIDVGKSKDDDPDLKVEYPDDQLLRSASGLFISGGPCSAYESIPWLNNLIEFCEGVIKNHSDLKLFGICLGHQILARVLGSRVEPSKLGWELGTTMIELNLKDDNDHKEFIKENFDPRGDGSLCIHQLHRDIVADLPNSCISIGSSTLTSIQGFIKLKNSPPSKDNYNQSKTTLNDISILTFQGHPEFTKDLLVRTIKVRRSHGIFTDEVVDEVELQTKERDDGIWLTYQMFKSMKIF